MRKTWYGTPDAPEGSEQWRDGWTTGYEQRLIDEEREREQAADGPRTWAIEYPPAPPAGTRVETKGGDVFEVISDAAVSNGAVEYRWRTLLESFGPLTEVVETEVEAAARRLREAGYADKVGIAGDDPDIRTVLAHVLNGGTL